MTTGSITTADRYRLEWGGVVLELASRRSGLRTEVVLYGDGEAVADGAGVGRVLLPLPGDDADDTGPSVLVISAPPGTIARALLLVPKASEAADDEDDEEDELPEGLAKLVGFASAEKHPFEPPPGTLGARLLTFQRRHPKLYASRHVVLATAQVLLGLLGVAVFFTLVLGRVVEWAAERLPDVSLPEVDLPSIPWPDLPLPDPPDLPDLPDVALPGWIAAVLATAKFWVPILIAIGVAVEEVRKRRKRERARAEAAEAPETLESRQDGVGGDPRDGEGRDADR
ncbi:hypothetical protein [Thermomonospora umbrina]|uniref:Uncharacterized protein n=1 Tax=Thermomonospora umbrina TaxID=111806 RepID=A0A3D9SM55_9ACTN|nr:hypothetical protein [Thermomonospora umbrina]REE96928.1 hypothetical protein DFJ69_2381 [Thermomonospora umbrina]